MNKVVKFVLVAAGAMGLGNTVLALADDAPPPKAQVSLAAGKDLKAAQPGAE